MPSVRNLDHERAVESRVKRDASGSVQDLGTTAKLPPELRNPEWMADLEYVWRVRTAAELGRLHRRARWQRRRQLDMGRRVGIATQMGDRDAAGWCATARVTFARSEEWAEHRAQALALPRAEVVAVCGQRWRKVRCGCRESEVRVGCDQVQLCQRCRERHWRRWRRRITRAMDSHLRAARARWFDDRRRMRAKGKLPGVYLVTLTVEHSGSIAEDRRRLAEGWRGLSKVANAGGWWGAYALTYEVTPGRDGLGHVHIHLAAVSSWIPYEELHEAWRRLTGACVLDVSAPRSRKAQSVADYLAKYVTKGVDPSVFTGQKAGEMLVAFRSKRKVTTSVGFWKPSKDRETVCRTCGKPHELVGAPPALRKVAPGAVLQAMAERIGWWVPRGAVQVKLNLGGSDDDGRPGGSGRDRNSGGGGGRDTA